MADLEAELRRIDGRGYKAYKDIQGAYTLPDMTLFIDHVQGDPFAAPSRLRVRIAQDTAEFPSETYRGRSRRIALEDFVTRAFGRSAGRIARADRGSGKSGVVRIDRPGQAILERSAMVVCEPYVEARFVAGLPAFGRRVAGRHAAALLCEDIPRIAREAMMFAALSEADILDHVRTAEDADALRGQLDENGLLAFIADDAVLPRSSGVDDRPLSKGTVVPFASPASLRVTLDAPNAGSVTGMGVPHGVTLIVGGGYHGKSTVLRAIERGIYNHVPGDGRERVVSVESAVKIRSEDGRRIEKVGIAPFISHLPFGKDTAAFSSDDASGSTSQAANIIEALEVGASALLIDEDTSATNFMIRDHRMQELVAKEQEPITPFIDKVRQLYDELGVSTVLVIGGSGDYFDVADTVVCMAEYAPGDATARAQAIAATYRAERRAEGGDAFGRVVRRCPCTGSFDASKGRRDVKIGVRGLTDLQFGRHDVDLGALEQLVDVSQTRAMGDAIQRATGDMGDGVTLSAVLDRVMAAIAEDGLDVLGRSRYPTGDYAAFRRFELAAAINRLRTLQVVPDSQ